MANKAQMKAKENEVQKVDTIVEKFTDEQKQLIQRIVDDAVSRVKSEPIMAVLTQTGVQANTPVTIVNLTDGEMYLKTNASDGAYGYTMGQMFSSITLSKEHLNSIIINMRNWFDAGCVYVKDDTEDQEIVKALMLQNVQSKILTDEEVRKIAYGEYKFSEIRDIMFDSKGKLVRGTFKQIKYALMHYTSQCRENNVILNTGYLNNLVKLLNKMTKACTVLSKSKAEANRTYTRDMFYDVMEPDSSGNEKFEPDWDD